MRERDGRILDEPRSIARWILLAFAVFIAIGLSSRTVRERITLRRIEAPLSEFHRNLVRGGRQYSIGASLREELPSKYALWHRLLLRGGRRERVEVWEDRVVAHVKRGTSARTSRTAAGLPPTLRSTDTGIMFSPSSRSRRYAAMLYL